MWGTITVETAMFTEIMKTDLAPEIIVQVVQKPDDKKIVTMVVQKENVVLRMLDMLVTVEMFTGMIHAMKEEA